jgi:Tol biopolymer transport system component
MMTRLKDQRRWTTFMQITRVVAVAVLALATGVVAAPAQASYPGPVGRLALARPDAAGFDQIWVAGADLSGAVQVTSGEFGSNHPDWSPDGTRLAFDSDRTGAFCDVFSMRPDGSDVTQLTDFGVGDCAGQPNWSPDGGRITYSRDNGGPEAGIWTMAADGSDPRRVTVVADNALFDASPRYSPDGQLIAFTRVRHPHETRPGRTGNLTGATGAVFVVRPDGSGLRRLTSWGHPTGLDVDWSPDGSELVFETDGISAGATRDIKAVRVVDGRVRSVTNNPPLAQFGGDRVPQLEISSDPTWAPDGSQILFVHFEITDGEFHADLWTVRPDGSDLAVLARTPEIEDQPDWESVRL